ncbi:hypothetical protein GGF37_005111, partial [Kickxella alabastrina]
RRPWLVRAQSSEILFFNTVLETSQQLSQQSSASGHSESTTLRADQLLKISDTHIEMEGTRNAVGEERLWVVCALSSVPAKRVMAMPGSGLDWIVEHVSGQASVLGQASAFGQTGDAGQAKVGCLLLGSSVVCSWWMDPWTVGVVTRDDSGMLLFVIDFPAAVAAAAEDCGRLPYCHADRAVARLGPVESSQEPALGLSGACIGAATGPTIARGNHIVQAMGGVLKTWRIDRRANGGKVSVIRDEACLAESILGGQDVIDLRWTGDGVGLGATRSRAFWFSLPATGGRTVCIVPCDSYDRLLPGMASWRWGESVVATAPCDKRELPPQGALLCLPSPTGVSFYSSEGQQAGVEPVYTQMFSKGWVWLCGSETAFVTLSPCRQMATVCRMPMGEPLYTLRVHDRAGGKQLIQDGWMTGVGAGCAISTGSALYLVGWQKSN